MAGLTHIDKDGKAVMVDISGKAVTTRTARAGGQITMSAEAFDAICQGTVAKGDVIGTARIAGIMAAKRTSDTIPLCHPLLIDKIEVNMSFDDENRAVICECTVLVTGRTGAEMEALTGVSAALLTVYDMCKAIDREMVIGELCLLEKEGGKSGHFVKEKG